MLSLGCVSGCSSVLHLQASAHVLRTHGSETRLPTRTKESDDLRSYYSLTTLSHDCLLHHLHRQLQERSEASRNRQIDAPAKRELGDEQAVLAW